MIPKWSIKNEIARRAQLESLYEWAKSKQTTELPKYSKQPKKKFSLVSTVALLKEILP